MVSAGHDGVSETTDALPLGEGARRTFHRDEPGIDSAERVRDRAVVMLAPSSTTYNVVAHARTKRLSSRSVASALLPSSLWRLLDEVTDPCRLRFAALPGHGPKRLHRLLEAATRRRRERGIA